MCYRFYSTVCLSSFSYASVGRDHSHSKASVFNGLKALLDRSFLKVDRLNKRYGSIPNSIYISIRAIWIKDE